MSGGVTTDLPLSVLRPHFMPYAPPPRLFAGPLHAESWEEHLARLGSIHAALSSRQDLLQVVRQSGLGGRGGSGFPVADKISALHRREGIPTVIINGAESEPASRKDFMLATFRPHLVVDGAVAAAFLAGADRVVIYLHRRSIEMYRALLEAVKSRAAAGSRMPPITFALGPDRYVAGESSAVVSFVGGREARPARHPVAGTGTIGDSPTIVHNLETVAHLALVVRNGADWFRGCGTDQSPGSVLVTLGGDVPAAGLVVELTAPTTIGALLEAFAPGTVEARSLLLGGYAGTWMAGVEAADLGIAQDLFAAAGVSLGCGFMGVLSSEHCGIAETAAILEYFARESAQQCGPCVFGLTGLAKAMTGLSQARAPESVVQLVRKHATLLYGRGSCRHPDGAVLLALSALDVFASDATHHAGGSPCHGSAMGRTFPIPELAREWR